MTLRQSALILTLVVATPCHSQTPQTRLWDAAISGDTSALAAALKDGAQIERLDRRTSQNGRRALNSAALNNLVDAIRFLLAYGASIEATNFTGFTALHHAAEYGSLDATRMLLAAGAAPQHNKLYRVTPPARAPPGGVLGGGAPLGDPGRG